MALFPAYKPRETEIETEGEVSLPWLQNESCPPEVSVVGLTLSQDSQVSKPLTSFSETQRNEDANQSQIEKNQSKKKKKKSKKKKLKESSDYYYSSSEEIHSDHSRSGKKKCKKKSHKRSSKSQPESLERSRNKSKGHKKRQKKLQSSSQSSSSQSGSEERSSRKNIFEDDKSAKIPTHNGETKSIFLAGLRPMTLEEAAYFDRDSDKNNLIFCNTHYSQVANYSKLSPLPLGMDHWLYFANKRKKKKEKRYFSKSIHVQESIPVMKLLNENFDSGYIPIQLTHSEEKKVEERLSSSSIFGRLGILDSATEDYILGRKKMSSEETNLPQENNSERKYWQDQIKSFNERLAKEPHNVPLWLEFVNIQDKAISLIFDSDNQKGKAKGKNFKLVTERKISVLESAIIKNIKSLELYLKRLHLGQDIWDNNQLKSEWDKLVRNFPNNMNMWHHYLIFHQTYFSVFHLERVVQAYAKCLERLIQMQRGTFLSHKPPENIGYALIDLMTQLAFIWYQGGYIERSIALFQALIELNLFCPQKLKGEIVNTDSKLALFEAFWDSKAPRFGEKDSIGWDKFMEKWEPVEFPEEILEGMHDEEDEILLKGGSRHELWLQMESSRELNHWLPWQQDPENCEDLERMVSFSVVKKSLFFTGSEEEAFYLILQFLIFLGVSLPSSIMSASCPSSKASVFYPLRLETLKTIISTKEMNSESIFDFPVIGPSIHKTKSESYFSFICEIISRSMSVVSDSAKPKLVIILIKLLAERCLILQQSGHDQLASVIKTYKKTIKNLLKQDEFRTDLEIYYEYAHFEASLGYYEEAFKIHSTALTLGLQVNLDILSVNANGEVLWRHLISLVLLEFERNKRLSQKNVNQVLNAVCSVLLDRKFSASKASPNGAHILRAKKKLCSLMEMKLNLSSDNQAEMKLLNYSVTLLSVLQLLTIGFKPASLVFEEFLNRIKKQEEDLNCLEKVEPKSTNESLQNVKEQLYENYLWLINVAPKLSHIFPSLPMSPSLVRELLKSAISVAPNNVLFLKKFAEYQSWRDILCGHDFHQNDDAGILVIIFRLFPHIKKVMNMMSSAEFGVVSAGYQLENVLESAVRTTSGKNCPLLWRLYLRLIQATRPNQLKKVAYRALDSCPNAKCLYLDCITLVPGTMSDILRLMGEKGIRIRLPLEELDVLLEEEKVCEEDDDIKEDTKEDRQTSSEEEHSS